MKSYGIVILLYLPLSGCHTSTIDPAYATHANIGFAAQEKVANATPTGAEMKERLVRLWVDRPEYIELLMRDPGPEKLPRLISSVPPSYPTVPYLANLKARVMVSFVVAPDGTVEEARVYESSDSRFDQPALEAIRRWKFIPAVKNGEVTKEVVTIPLQFEGRKK
jgi:protein TonB